MATKKTIELKSFDIQTIQVEIESISPLIVHRFSEKTEKMMEDKQRMGAKSSKHELRNPEQECEDAKHKSPQGWEGFPAAGFKAAMTRGAKMTGLVMKDTQTSLFVVADCPEKQLVRIVGESEMDHDNNHVRVGNGSADLRYRPVYKKWGATLTIEYNAGMVSIDQICQMVSAAGYGCGIGEMRPEKTKFSYGRFKIKNVTAIEKE